MSEDPLDERAAQKLAGDGQPVQQRLAGGDARAHRHHLGGENAQAFVALGVVFVFGVKQAGLTSPVARARGRARPARRCRPPLPRRGSSGDSLPGSKTVDLDDGEGAQAAMFVADPERGMVDPVGALGHDDHVPPRQYLVNPAVEDGLDGDFYAQLFSEFACEVE